MALYFDWMDEAEQIEVVTESPDEFQHIASPTEAVQLAAVRADPRVIEHIQNPSEAVQMATRGGWLHAGMCELIKNPTEAVQLAMVAINWYAVWQIERPTTAAQLAALQKASGTSVEVDNPGEALEQLRTIERNVRYDDSSDDYPADDPFLVYDPALDSALGSEVVQLAAVRMAPNAIEYIPDPSEAVQLAAVQSWVTAIGGIKNPTEAAQLAAVEQADNSTILGWIENPTEAAQLAAVKWDYKALQFIKAPTYEVQLHAVLVGGANALDYINDPAQIFRHAYDLTVKALGVQPGSPAFAETFRATYDALKDPDSTMAHAYDLTVKALAIDPESPGFSEAFRATYDAIKNPEPVIQTAPLPGLENLDFKLPAPSYEF